MKKPFLELHKRLLKRGLSITKPFNEGGLCNQYFQGRKLSKNSTFRMVEPQVTEPECFIGYWGYSETDYLTGLDRQTGYTPLRQNIILLCAAINNEL